MDNSLRQMITICSKASEKKNMKKRKIKKNEEEENIKLEN
jgi:hypothetical protein